MQLFIKTELEMHPLLAGVHKGFCSGQKLAVGSGDVSNKTFFGYLIPPNIGELVLYRNSGAFLIPEMSSWSFYVQVENLPDLTKPQEEMIWTQLKMSGCFLGAQKIATEVKAIKPKPTGLPTGLINWLRNKFNHA